MTLPSSHWELADLEGAGLPGIRQVLYLRETRSTNEVGVEWARQGASHGCLVITDHQTGGKGRLGRGWFDPPGKCLLLSLVLRPRLPSAELPLVGLGAGVALCEALSELGLQARLKWPNDVTIGGSKVAGILSEVEGGAVILGVGVNVNVEAFPPHLQGSATSLAIEAGRPFDRLRVLHTFLASFQRVYSSLPEGLQGSYRPWCETLGRWVAAEVNGGVVRDRAVDIDSSGGLVLASGAVLRAGQVVHLRESDANAPGPIRMDPR